jgi:hypothetical protein
MCISKICTHIHRSEHIHVCRYSENHMLLGTLHQVRHAMPWPLPQHQSISSVAVVSRPPAAGYAASSRELHECTKQGRQGGTVVQEPLHRGRRDDVFAAPVYIL